jgi:cytochrome c peroxidase
MSMKKKLIVAIIIGAVIALAIPVLNLFIGSPTGTDLTRLAEAQPEVMPSAKLLEQNCANCHTMDTKLPFYAYIPGFSSIVEADVETGRRYFDLTKGMFPDADQPATETTLAKIEWQIDSGAMPPLPYKSLHWDAFMSSADLETLHDWIRSTRIKNYAESGLDEELAARPIHPLPQAVKVNSSKVSLGKRLYFDKRLSGDETLSCASCHDLTKGGTDQERVSTGIRGQKGGINAPTSFNALFALAQFWDGRAASLEEQAGGPPLNPIEMGATWEQIVGRLEADEAFATEFRAAYPEGITPDTITHAIAEFERTLITPNCPFDLFLKGDQGALSADARRGWDLFQAQGCQSCHVGKAMGGQSYEEMGRAEDYFGQRGDELTDADQGRFNVTKAATDRHRFKVPILRNVALTHPYFHDGSVADLTAAVEAMARFQMGAELSDDDITAIVRFLESLTGTYEGQPLS